MYNEIFDIDFIMAAKPKYNPKSEIKTSFQNFRWKKTRILMKIRPMKF